MPLLARKFAVGRCTGILRFVVNRSTWTLSDESYYHHVEVLFLALVAAGIRTCIACDLSGPSRRLVAQHVSHAACGRGHSKRFRRECHRSGLCLRTRRNPVVNAVFATLSVSCTSVMELSIATDHDTTLALDQTNRQSQYDHMFHRPNLRSK